MFKLSKADREFIESHRGCYSPHPHWYAAYTCWGRERQVCTQAEKELAGEGIEELFLPELKSRAEAAPGNLLFGGYLFFRCRMSDPIYVGLTSLPNVNRIFGRAYRIPEIIGDEDMRLFRAMLDATPPPGIAASSHAGSHARVAGGMLDGLRGRVIEVSSQYVKMEVDYLFLDQGSSILISIPKEQVRLETTNRNIAKIT